MKYNKLGRMNLRISALSIGGHMDWGKTMGRDEVEPLMVAAYEGGVNFFDSAERYGDGACETIIGEIIQRQTWPRESLVLGTKVSPRGTEAAKGSQIGLSRKRLIDALEVTLKRYRTDYLDLYILHRPDPESDPEEIVRTMNDLI